MKFLLCILLLIAHPAWAQLGETNSVCTARYGLQFRGADGPVKGVVNKRSAILTFQSGLCVAAMYYTNKHPVTGIVPDLPETERTRLLSLNTGGSSWTIVQETDKVIEWRTADGARVASYDVKEATLLMKLAPPST